MSLRWSSKLYSKDQIYFSLIVVHRWNNCNIGAIRVKPIRIENIWNIWINLISIRDKWFNTNMEQEIRNIYMANTDRNR